MMTAITNERPIPVTVRAVFYKAEGGRGSSLCETVYNTTPEEAREIFREAIERKKKATESTEAA